LLLRFVPFAGDRGCQRRCRKGKGEEAENFRPVCGGAWNHAPPPVGRVGRRAATVHAVPEGLPSTVMEF